MYKVKIVNACTTKDLEKSLAELPENSLVSVAPFGCSESGRFVIVYKTDEKAEGVKPKFKD